MPIFEQYICLQEWKLEIEKHRSVLEYLVPHWRRHRSATEELSIALTTTPLRSVDMFRLITFISWLSRTRFHAALTHVSAPILIPVPQLYKRPCYGSLLAQRLLVTISGHYVLLFLLILA